MYGMCSCQINWILKAWVQYLMFNLSQEDAAINNDLMDAFNSCADLFDQISPRLDEEMKRDEEATMKFLQEDGWVTRGMVDQTRQAVDSCLELLNRLMSPNQEDTCKMGDVDGLEHRSLELSPLPESEMPEEMKEPEENNQPEEMKEPQENNMPEENKEPEDNKEPEPRRATCVEVPETMTR